MSFENLKVSTRLSAAFGLVLALLVIVAASGYAKMNHLNQVVASIASDKVPTALAGFDWEVSVLKGGRHMRNALLLDDPAEVKNELATLARLKSERMEIMNRLEKSVTSPSGKLALQAAVDARAAYTPVEDEFVRLMQAGDKAQAKTVLLQQGRPLQLAYLQALGKFVETQRALIDAGEKEAEQAYETGRNTAIALVLLALAMGSLAALLVSRSLLKQLGGEPAAAADLARAVADGNLSTVIDVAPGDTISLMAQLKAMQDNLAKVVLNVRSSAEGVATASSQIAQGNNDLSSRTEEQASSLEETAASMEQLGVTVRLNADNAKQANQLAHSASAVAMEGGEVVSQVVVTMKGINDSSKKISDIISVIDGIAFQTNILALNAAVEAARAGEQGRGFAVVASEVRSLAQRSAEAAKEIKVLINASVERVEEGTSLVDRAGATMTEVVTSIKRVTDIMGEISAASTEQSQGVTQVCEAVTQMDQVTQQNAALVEESAAAAESLKTQAQQLVQVVAVFKLSASIAVASPDAIQRPPTAFKSALVAERRGPVGAKNVARPVFNKPAQAVLVPLEKSSAMQAAAPAKAGADDWETF